MNYVPGFVELKAATLINDLKLFFYHLNATDGFERLNVDWISFNLIYFQQSSNLIFKVFNCSLFGFKSDFLCFQPVFLHSVSKINE